MNRKDKKRIRAKRKKRVRSIMLGTKNKPRLSVFRSLKHVYIQAIDDVNGTTICSASTLDKELKARFKKNTNTESAKLLGTLFADRLKKNNITTAVFDRGPYKYHGRIKALADGIREKGITF